MHIIEIITYIVFLIAGIIFLTFGIWSLILYIEGTIPKGFKKKRCNGFKFKKILYRSSYDFHYFIFGDKTIKNLYGKNYDLVREGFFDECGPYCHMMVKSKGIKFLIGRGSYNDKIMISLKEQIDKDTLHVLEDNLTKANFIDAILEASKQEILYRERKKNKKDIKFNKRQMSLQKKIKATFN